MECRYIEFSAMKISFIKELLLLRYGISSSLGSGDQSDELLDGVLHTVGKDSGIGIYIVEGDRIQFVNSHLLNLSGYSENELIGRNPKDAVVIENPGTDQPYECKLVKKNGHTDWVIETSTPIYYGRNHRAIVHFVQLNEGKILQATLDELTEFSSKLLSNSPNPIIVINTDTSIRYANQAVKKITGYYLTEIIGIKEP